jgi:hypothetical protein
LLPASGVAFSWNDDSTLLTVTPAEPLTLATGNDPDDVEPTNNELAIAASAESAEGAPLAEDFAWSFATLRRITASLQSVRNRNLTGNFRSNNTQGVGQCTGNGSTNVCVGDSVLNNARYRGFLTFELGAIPVPVTELEAATLSLGVSNLLGDPFDDLGPLQIARVNFAQINQAAFQTNVLTNLGVLANDANQGATIRRDVRDAIELDLASRTRAQFRLQFDDASDQDFANDVLVSSWTTHQLEITYLVP